MNLNMAITREMRRSIAVGRMMESLPVLVGFVFLAATLPACGQDDTTQLLKANSTISLPVERTPVQFDAAYRESFAPVVKKVAPAVVKLVIAASDKGLAEQTGFGSESSRRPLKQGIGSGVVVTEDGYILTNNHVVDGAKEVNVTLPDGREFKAEVIGRDSQSDIAVLKIDAKRLPVLTLADSQKVQVGDLVLAIGNPFGVGQTVTHGIVSATDRGGMGLEDYESFVQTDAPINPGNSGGALVDINGCLVGINTAILSGSGGNQGIGFAIPSDLARSVMTSLMQYGRVIRGYLGVELQDLDLTPDPPECNAKQATGVKVINVVANGPADRAGFKVGDVITAYNGTPVSDGRRLKLSVAETKPSQIIPVEIVRDNSTKTLQVTIGELPSSERLAKGGQSAGQDSDKLICVLVCDLNHEMKWELKIPRSVRGALVLGVQPESAAGLQLWDVIQSINGHSIRRGKDAEQAAKNTQSKRMELRVWTKGASHSVVLDGSHVQIIDGTKC